ncbi:FKBP-type peptidyl-prolyl cis-trans isomerase [Alkalitalea saponilacus]|uniref:Uncharacterized protein n=1 Tax=Alkalitalea saponilacus TaxID=889453 RepID=A0A1T5D8A3_9BACT|nr:hypothetical protein [Alkalitalea saponilacus]ASB50615.1 hypothetical protein CDL62_16415 [Alkalitalea saponilacus]SKB67856.1 hypothetical protein SAMN03080601_01020 [Alkalitalea saponilacus]
MFLISFFKKIVNAILGLSIFTLLAIGCSDPYRGIDYTRFQREEAKLLAEFYEMYEDSLFALAVDTIIDNREKSGLLFLGTERGVGDTLGLHKYASFRYDYYELLRHPETEKPALLKRYSNYGGGEPDVIRIGDESWFSGLHEGMSFMRIGGKATLVIPSTIGTRNEFITIVIDVEVTTAEF